MPDEMNEWYNNAFPEGAKEVSLPEAYERCADGDVKPAQMIDRADYMMSMRNQNQGEQNE